MRTFVVLFDVVVDFRDQFFDAFERTTADGLLGDEVKPDFDLIEP